MSELNEQIHHLTGFDMVGTAEKMRYFSEKMDKQKTVCDYLEEQVKVTRAALMEEHRAVFKEREEKVTIAQLENLAMTDPAYDEALQSLRSARETLAADRAQYFYQRQMIDISRSQLSYYKTVIDMEGGPPKRHRDKIIVDRTTGEYIDADAPDGMGLDNEPSEVAEDQYTI